MASIPWEKFADDDDAMALLDDDGAASQSQDSFETPVVEEVVRDSEGRASKRARVSQHGNVNALPSTEEMAKLKETESAFKSSLFTLQARASSPACALSSALHSPLSFFNSISIFICLNFLSMIGPRAMVLASGLLDSARVISRSLPARHFCKVAHFCFSSHCNIRSHFRSMSS